MSIYHSWRGPTLPCPLPLALAESSNVRPYLLLQRKPQIKTRPSITLAVPAANPTKALVASWSRSWRRRGLKFRSRARSFCSRRRRSRTCRTSWTSRRGEWQPRLRRCRTSLPRSLKPWRRSLNCARMMRWSKRLVCRSWRDKSPSYSGRRPSRWMSWLTNRL